MSITTASAAELITASVADAQARPVEDARSAAAIAGAAKDDFCTIWPQAKPLLAVAATVLPFLPGAGAVAGPVLTGLIKIGDQIAAEKCG